MPVVYYEQCMKEIAGLRRSSTEVSGLGLDANLLRFAKQHLAAQWVHPLIGSTVFSLSAEAGILLPWGHDWHTKHTYISERQASLPKALSDLHVAPYISAFLAMSCNMLMSCPQPCLADHPCVGWVCRAILDTGVWVRRFFLGGVHGNLRGFHFKGAGPTAARPRVLPLSCAHL